MKFLALTFSLFSIAIMANPLPQEDTGPVKSVPEGFAAVAAASQRCRITADGVRYRRCPSTSCDAVGQYPIGTYVTFTCYAVGQRINGTPFWDRNTNGYYVTEAYIDPSCAAKVLTPC